MVYAPYNLTMISGEGVQPMLHTVNDNLMFGLYGVLALLAIGVILFLSMMAYSNNLKKSLGLSSLICAVLSIGFRMIDLVSDQHILICWVIAAVVVMLSLLIPD